MFEYKNDGVELNIKDELMTELVNFAKEAKDNGIIVPTWLEASVREYKKKLITTELANMVLEDGYSWFKTTVNREEAENIFSMVAYRYMTLADKNDIDPDERRHQLDVLLADTHYGFVTIRDSEEERE